MGKDSVNYLLDNIGEAGTMFMSSFIINLNVFISVIKNI